MGHPTFVLQSGHTGPVFGVAGSPNGLLIVSGSADRSVKIWDVGTRAVRATLHGHADEVRDVASSLDGGTIASACGDGSIVLWDAVRGAPRATLVGHSGPVRSVAWSPTGGRLASAGTDGTIRLWEIDGAPVQVVDGECGAITAIAWSPDGTSLAVACGDGSVRVRDAATGRLLRRIDGHERAVLAVAWSPDGTRIASGGEDRSARTWDAASGDAVAVLRPHEGGVASVVWSPDARSIATSDGIVVRLWDVERGVVRDAPEEMRGPTDLFWSAGGLVVAGTWDGSLAVWDATRRSIGPSFPAGSGAPSAVAWSADGSSLASAHWDGSVLVWDVRAGRLRAAIDAHEGRAGDVQWTVDGSTLFSSGRDEIRSWDAESLSLRGLFEIPEGFVCSAPSPDGSLIASGSNEGAIRIRDAANGRVRRILRGHRGRVSAVDWSPDGLVLASASADGTARLWDPRTGALRLSLTGHARGTYRVAFGPDGTAVATAAADGTLRVWDARTGSERLAIPSDGRSALGIAWSPDGRTLSTTGWDGALLLRDATSGAVGARLEGTEGPLVGHAWGPDGSVVATAGASLRLHRIADGESLLLERVDLPDRTASLAHTEAGLFAGDDAAFASVLFRLGDDVGNAEILSADQLFESFHRPSLVADFLHGSSLEPLSDVRAGIGLPPVVTFDEAPPRETSRGIARVRVRALDRGGGVSEVRLFANGTRVRAAPNPIPVRDGRGPAKVWQSEVPLAPGLTEIAAEAYNVAGRVRSPRSTVQTRFREEAGSLPNLFLLVLTLDEYEDPAQSLSFANADGDAVVEAFRRQERELFGRVIVTRLRDADATLSSVERTMEGLAFVVGGRDVFVLYAAGHGALVRCSDTEPARYHMLTHGARLRNERSICREGLSDTRLGELLGRIPSQRKLLLLDTCHGGAAATARTVDAIRHAEETDAIMRLARTEGLAVAGAAKDTEHAGEVPELGHGVFTSVLVDGLRGSAAAPGSTMVTAFGLLRHLEENVARLSRRYFARPQYPITSTQGRDFPLATVARE